MMTIVPRQVRMLSAVLAACTLVTMSSPAAAATVAEIANLKGPDRKGFWLRARRRKARSSSIRP